MLQSICNFTIFAGRLKRLKMDGVVFITLYFICVHFSLKLNKLLCLPTVRNHFTSDAFSVNNDDELRNDQMPFSLQD